MIQKHRKLLAPFFFSILALYIGKMGGPLDFIIVKVSNKLAEKSGDLDLSADWQQLTFDQSKIELEKFQILSVRLYKFALYTSTHIIRTARSSLTYELYRATLSKKKYLYRKCKEYIVCTRLFV